MCLRICKVQLQAYKLVCLCVSVYMHGICTNVGVYVCTSMVHVNRLVLSVCLCTGVVYVHSGCLCSFVHSHSIYIYMYIYIYIYIYM